MSDAFNNYCISCDQLCAANAIYCSPQCRDKDEHNHVTNLDVANADIVSPLLTPSLYQQQHQVHELAASPLLLPSNLNDADMDDLVVDWSHVSITRKEVPHVALWVGLYISVNRKAKKMGFTRKYLAVEKLPAT